MKNERGSAMLVVLTLTILVASLVVVNSFVLSPVADRVKTNQPRAAKEVCARAGAKN